LLTPISLFQLVVTSCKLNGETVTPIAFYLATAPCLAVVDLSWNPIRREGASVIVTALQTSPCLTSLSLAGCMLGPQGGRLVAAAAAARADVGEDKRGFCLTDLNLSFNGLGAGVADALAKVVKFNNTLVR
ncbi:unnamed protein product, partial [Choristocarpus tenellus]